MTSPGGWMSSVFSGLLFGKTSSKKMARLGILEISIFVDIIRKERARSDRSGDVFTLVVFPVCFRGQKAVDPDYLVRKIKKSLRFLDTLGWLDEEHVAVLMPETPYEGGERFIDRVLGEEKGSIASEIYTYPAKWIPYSNVALEGGAVPASEAAEGKLEERAVFALKQPMWKRAMDIVVSLLALAVLWPIMLITAVFIKIVSPTGPILFHHQRVGLGCRTFKFYKFRTMKPNDETTHQQHIIEKIRSGNNLEKYDDIDPRIIPGGRFIRSACIDELPQLFNVLKGDMSLVGPRPCVPYEAKEFLRWHAHRFDVLPGMTGLWQVSGKNKLTLQQMIRLDISYAQRITPLRDLGIIFRTFPVVVQLVKESVEKKASRKRLEKQAAIKDHAVT